MMLLFASYLEEGFSSIGLEGYYPFAANLGSVYTISFEYANRFSDINSLEADGWLRYKFLNFGLDGSTILPVQIAITDAAGNQVGAYDYVLFRIRAKFSFKF